MKFGTELRVLGDYATVLCNSPNALIKASFLIAPSSTFYPKFFSPMLLKEFRPNCLVGGSAVQIVRPSRTQQWIQKGSFTRQYHPTVQR